MRKIITFGLIFFVSLSLSACIQVDTVVKVKPDGSGVVEETFLMRKDLLQQMKEMIEAMAKQMEQAMTEGKAEGETQQAPDSQVKAKPFDIFDEAKLREKASEMGEGVTYISGSKIVTDEHEGYKAIYAFKDINKVRINQNPEEKVPSASQQEPTDDKKKKEYVVFNLTKGNPAELLIQLPADKTEKESKDVPEDQKTAPEDDQQSEEMMAQMKKIFEGMKIALAVEVDGTILETNATHREGSKVTLMELDFGKLIEMQEQFKKFSQSQPGSLEEAKKFMQDIPGIKVDLNDEVRIKFR